MIEVRGVTKTYGKRASAFTALDDINFTIPDGKSVAILGKSGSGKSTLMHAISGLDQPQQGEVLIDGMNILKLKRKPLDTFRAKTIGFIFQSFFVQANESCYDNVSLPLEISNVKRGSRRARVRTALESVDLGDKVTTKAKNLSGGQKQRLAIARAIVGRPRVLFADEPTGNLDSVTSEKVEDLLFGYARDNDATLILVTHDEDLSRKCDIIIRIKDGRIESVIDTSVPPSPIEHGDMSVPPRDFESRGRIRIDVRGDNDEKN
jgi:putative ABC transport system ATP-binding protein